jgi:hypothetical protein
MEIGTCLLARCWHNTERKALMRKRVTALLISALAVGAIGGTAGMATAKNGADDPAGDVRQGRGADDPAGHVRHSGTDDSAKARKVRARKARHGRGRDDAPGHVRHGRGTDDGPNHR